MAKHFDIVVTKTYGIIPIRPQKPGHLVHEDILVVLEEVPSLRPYRIKYPVPALIAEGLNLRKLGHDIIALCRKF
ncbi:MAG: hypothetical protein IJM68_00310 [Synergistaceae bacterium]|nr:hypothetical protein [Synergistaceae bacterium]MBQ6972333.1 hypothetical protein [Synergistaceae bacterium]